MDLYGMYICIVYIQSILCIVGIHKYRRILLSVVYGPISIKQFITFKS